MLYSYKYKHIYNIDTKLECLQYKNYRNNAEKPQQDTVKKPLRKSTRNWHCKTELKTMAKLTKNMQKVCKTQLKMKSPY